MNLWKFVYNNLQINIYNTNMHAYMYDYIHVQYQAWVQMHLKMPHLHFWNPFAFESTHLHFGNRNICICIFFMQSNTCICIKTLAFALEFDLKTIAFY